MAVSVVAPITPSVLTWARQQAAVSVQEFATRTYTAKPSPTRSDRCWPLSTG